MTVTRLTGVHRPYGIRVLRLITEAAQRTRLDAHRLGHLPVRGNGDWGTRLREMRDRGGDATD
ncbi:MAG: hypothetical protein HKL86_07560 [Acidimicrobiaceae bacterium]|nr:hypothetical protein [Acidimicrobiaceae bacterium]